MVRKKIVASVLTMCLAASAFSTTAQAENKKFSFRLTSTASKESTRGTAKKSLDGDTYAYVTPNASESNLAVQGATVKFRVRDNAKKYATNVVTCNAYKKYKLSYLSGKAVGGATYRLYANVTSTNEYPVKLGGRWCP